MVITLGYVGYWVSPFGSVPSNTIEK